MHEQFLSIPFREQGRDYDGADCWGLVYLFFRDVLNIELRSFSEYSPNELRTVAALMAVHKDEWNLSPTPAPNDVVLMRCTSSRFGRLVAHVGIVMDGGRVMHTDKDLGVRNEKLSAFHVQPRLIEFRRHTCLI